MTKETVRNLIAQIGIFPAIRVSSAEDASFAVEALAESGIPIAEVTMTTPCALDVISQFGRSRPELVIGAGTVRDVETARRCLGAGAKFLTSPGLHIQVVEFAVREGVVVLPGALTPSEIMAASNAGADFVKVFPCSVLGGVSYIRALRSPFPDIPLIAAGGVTQQNVADFILAGATGVGIGRDLINPEAVKRRELVWIRELARRFVQIIRDTRSQMSA